MTNHYYHLLATLMLALFPALLMAQPESQDSMAADSAASSIPHRAVRHNPKAHKTVAVISSFAQDSPWSDDYIPPVTAAASSNPNTYCDIYYLQSLQITNIDEYNQVKESLFNYYRDKTPDYVVMIGKMAFTMRDEMIKEWGNIPMFLIANSADLAPLDYYFSGTDLGSEAEVVQKGKLYDLQKEYNFTALIVPYLYRQTVQLMIETMHRQINELIFVAVPTYVDRNNSKRIFDYLRENYPGIQYRWLSADNENVEELRSLLIEKRDGTGILLSNWAIIGEGPFGDRIIINQEAKLLSSSVNPVFVASASLINNGAAGGVFLNRDDIRIKINSIVDAMLSGDNMSEIPIYKCEKETSVINYDRAKQYDLNLKGLGDNVVIEGRPLSFWDEYRWQTIIGVLVLFIFGVMVWKRNKSQAQEIELLQMHSKFVKGMPVAYARATLNFGEDGKRLDSVTYSDVNDAMQDIISKSGNHDGERVIFPKEFIREKALELSENKDEIRFLHHFESTGTDQEDLYFDFAMDIAKTDDFNKTNKTIMEVDIFAIDVTSREEGAQELKKLSRKLDLTINAAGIIPWEWDIKRDVLKFDAYSLFSRQLHDVEGEKGEVCTYLDVNKEFMPLIHPDDVTKLEENSMKLLSKRITSFTLRYRLHIVRGGIDCYQWVKVRGALTEFDSKDDPTKAAGGMWLLEENEIVPEPME